MNYKQLALGALIGIIVTLGAGFLLSSTQLGAVVGVGQTETNTFWFVNGLFAGSSQQFKVDSSGNATFAGTATFTGAVSGISTSTLSSLSVFTATHSTVKIGSATSTGCLELGDSAGSAIVYITATGATITATTTKPAACN